MSLEAETGAVFSDKIDVIFKKSVFQIFNIRRIVDTFSKHIKETLTLSAGNFQLGVFSNRR